MRARMSNENKQTLAMFEDLLKDAKIGKDKHFQASRLKERIHFWLQLVVTGLSGAAALVSSLKPAAVQNHLLLIAAVCAGLAATIMTVLTTLKFEKQVEGQRRVGNKYAKMYRDGTREVARFRESRLTIVELDEIFGTYLDDYHALNTEAEPFSVHKRAVRMAMSKANRKQDESRTRDSVESDPAGPSGDDA